MTDELIAITTADGDLPAHLWRPSSGRGPGILLLQEIFGTSDYITRRAQDLADLGYVVLAPEIYWDSAVTDGVAALDRLGQLPEVTAASLHHFGLADSYIDAATVAHVEQSVAGRPGVVFETYPGADHAFDNPDFPLHDADASALAWRRTVDFLGARLPTA